MPMVFLAAVFAISMPWYLCFIFYTCIVSYHRQESSMYFTTLENTSSCL